jgi:hypothetical protein
MARRETTFRQTDVTRALKASTAAGINIARIEIDKSGKIVLITSGVGPLPADSEQNEWDSVK